MYEVITYDEPKRFWTLENRGLDMADLSPEFFDRAVIVPAREDRFMAIGWFDDLLIVTVVAKQLGTEAYSVISLRPASKKEREKYDENS